MKLILPCDYCVTARHYNYGHVHLMWHYYYGVAKKADYKSLRYSYIKIKTNDHVILILISNNKETLIKVPPHIATSHYT